MLHKTLDSPLIHIFWIDGIPPHNILQNISLWEQMYPERLVVWNDAAIQIEGWDKEFRNEWPSVMKVDLLRVLAIQKYGGWYVDADTVPLNDQMIDFGKLVLSREDGRRYWNGCFFSPSKHPFLEIWQNEILNSIAEMWPEIDDIARISGPHALSRAIYLYAFDFGLHSALRSIMQLPWGKIRFGDSPVLKFFWLRIYYRRSFLQHQSLATWKSTHIKSPNSFALRMYRLRQSPLATPLDLARQLLRNRHRSPRSGVHWTLLKVMDNEVLDGPGTWDLFYVKAKSYGELRSAVRDTTKGIINLEDIFLAKKLKAAGWKNISENLWLRPKVTNLVGHL